MDRTVSTTSTDAPRPRSVPGTWGRRPFAIDATPERTLTTSMTTAMKVRLRFAKHGDLRLVSHHDLMRCLERMLRRTGLPVAESQGFNPRPRVVFTLALALGIEGRHEALELDLATPVDPAEVLERFRAVSPVGLDWLEAEAVTPGRPSRAVAVTYQIDVPAERVDAAREALARFLASAHWPYARHRADRGETVAIDLRPFVLDADVGPEGGLSFRMKIDPGGSARPEEVLEALGLRDLPGLGAVLARTEMELAPRSQTELN